MDDLEKFLEVLLNEFNNKINSNCREAEVFLKAKRIVQEKYEEYKKSRK